MHQRHGIKYSKGFRFLDEATEAEVLEDFAQDFRADEHFAETISHKNFIVKVYESNKQLFPDVNLEQILEHDNSKMTSFIEVVGYTMQWTWKIKGTRIWDQALAHHYNVNPHHPEHYKENGGNMEARFLQESIIDMAACRWERILGGRSDVSRIEMFNINDDFLARYTPQDRKIVRDFLKNACKCG